MILQIKDETPSWNRTADKELILPDRYPLLKLHCKKSTPQFMIIKTGRTPNLFRCHCGQAR